LHRVELVHVLEADAIRVGNDAVAELRIHRVVILDLLHARLEIFDRHCPGAAEGGVLAKHVIVVDVNLDGVRLRHLVENIRSGATHADDRDLNSELRRESGNPAATG